MKTYTRSSLLLLLLFSLFLSACKEPPMAATEEASRPVRVQRVERAEKPILLRYVGRTSSESIKKYSFKVAARIKEIFVEKGDRIEVGQPLVKLDQRDYALSLDAARLSVQQAQDAFDDAQRTFTRVSDLFEAGARPENEYEKARLQLDLRQSTLEQAKLDLAHKRRTLYDTTLLSDVEGFVVNILAKEGEFIAPGHPVVIVRNEQQVVKVGVSQRDIKRINVGTMARVEVDDAAGEGKVVNIEQIPDSQSQTYEAEVALLGPLADKDFYIGALARVSFEIGTDSGIWIPSPAVLTEGMQYVYVADQGRAVRKTVTVGDVSGPYVKVEGLQLDERVIVEGMKNLKDGYKVEVLP